MFCRLPGLCAWSVLAGALGVVCWFLFQHSTAVHAVMCGPCCCTGVAEGSFCTVVASCVLWASDADGMILNEPRLFYWQVHATFSAQTKAVMHYSLRLYDVHVLLHALIMLTLACY